LASLYEDHYLQNYWPERPNNPDMWLDNLELLQAYFLAADQILAHEGKVNAVDISTGPCLAPLMATMACMDSVQLSDFDPSNRERIVDSDIGYWKEYAKELGRLFPDRGLNPGHLLTEVDQLRRQSPPLDVDLRRTPIFLPDIVEPGSVGLLTMHFVVDSICETSRECFELLDKALALVRPGGWLLLSALIDSSGWQLGDVTEPSPNHSEAEIDEFLAARSFRMISKTRSTRKAKQIYDGGWTVFLARKETS
jgi:hypothetical protein